MYKIISKEALSSTVKKLVIEAPDIARKALPGQFVVLRIDAKGERVPLTIVAADKAAGLITLIFQEVGFTTVKLGALSLGENIMDILGPLGHPAEIKKYGTVACVAGGVGAAEVLPVAGAMKSAGNKVIGILGARAKGLIILEQEMRASCDELFVATDDGSWGEKGLVTDVLNRLINSGAEVDLVYAIGPVAMMQEVAVLTKKYNIKTIVCLNPVMVDGTGMCGSCRVSVGGEIKFCCVDGPDFDAHKVDFRELSERLKLFKAQEQAAAEKHNCRIK